MDPSEVSRLSLRWLDGVATDAERGRLCQALVADASAALIFAQHARFEQLLSSAAQDRAQRAVVLAATEHQQTCHQRRQIVVRGLKVAALLLAVGPLVWLAWPRQEHDPGVVRKQQAEPPAPRARPGPVPATSVAVTTHESPPAAPAQPEKTALPAAPLAERLTTFYLPPMKFEQVTLAEALRQIEAQMKAINKNADSELARLLLQLPASAAQQKITFDSPGMGVLPLVQAVAGLAGCEASLSSDSLHLVLNLSTPQLQRQTRTFSTFTSEEELAAADQLAKDARAVGIDTSGWQVNDKGQRLPPAQITASAGQLKALDALSGARAALSQIPPMRVRALVVPRPPGAENRELTIKERDDYLARSDLTPSATFELKPGTQGVDVSPQPPETPQSRAKILVHSQDTPLLITNGEPQLAMNTPSAPVFTLRSLPMGHGNALAVSPSPRSASTMANYSNAESSSNSITGSITVPDSKLPLLVAGTAGSAANIDLMITSITMDHASATKTMWLGSSNNYAGAIVSLSNGSSLVILANP